MIQLLTLFISGNSLNNLHLIYLDKIKICTYLDKTQQNF